MDKKKMDFSKLFSNKKFKYGGYSLIIVIIGIALVVLLNYGLTMLEKNFDLRVDMTQNKKYSLADQTKKLVEGLKSDIYIYTTYAPGAEDKDVSQILQKIKALSGHVVLQNVDPDLNPVFFQKYETNGTKISTGEIIVSDKDGKLFRVLNQDAQYTTSYDQNTGATTVTQIKVEGAVVTAVNYIQIGYIPTVYLVTGHGEADMSSLADLSTSMSSGNYNFVSLNIAQAPDKIKAGDIVMMLDPQRDITQAERDSLKPLMEKGGRFYILLNPQYAGPGKMPNLESLLMLFDISLKSGVVIEGNTANEYTPSMPYALVPEVQDHAITTPIKSANYPLVIPFSGALKLPDAAPETSMTITSLLKTSDKAYLKSFDSLTSAKSVADLAKADTDEAGPFDLAVAIDKTNGSNAADDAKLVISYSSDFAMESGLIAASAPYEDNDLFMNSVGWMQNATGQDIYVRPKSISASVMNITNVVQFWIIAVIGILLVPVIMLVAGIVIYQRRKHL